MREIDEQIYKQRRVGLIFITLPISLPILLGVKSTRMIKNRMEESNHTHKFGLFHHEAATVSRRETYKARFKR